eukprot:scaffold13072_cov75-Isochrysis_galbana.AAC.1
MASDRSAATHAASSASRNRPPPASIAATAGGSTDAAGERSTKASDRPAVAFGRPGPGRLVGSHRASPRSNRSKMSKPTLPTCANGSSSIAATNRSSGMWLAHQSPKPTYCGQSARADRHCASVSVHVGTGRVEPCKQCSICAAR